MASENYLYFCVRLTAVVSKVKIVEIVFNTWHGIASGLDQAFQNHLEVGARAIHKGVTPPDLCSRHRYQPFCTFRGTPET
jgi:hypothetical protein